MQHINFHQIRAGDTIVMLTRFKDSHIIRVGIAAYQPDLNTWLTQKGLAAACIDPEFTLYKLNASDHKEEPWKTLLKSPGMI